MIKPSKSHEDERQQARERLRNLPAHQRDRWLDIAEAEFRINGFQAASLNGILARAGISKGQAYYYFADKGELYRAVIARALARIEVQIEALIEIDGGQAGTAAAFWQHLGAFFSSLTVVMARNEPLAELGRGIYRDAGAQAAIADLLDGLHARFAARMEAGQRLGAVRSDLPLNLLTDMAFAILREADRWFALNKPELDRDAALALNTRIFDLFRRLLAPEDAADLPKPSRDEM